MENRSFTKKEPTRGFSTSNQQYKPSERPNEKKLQLEAVGIDANFEYAPRTSEPVRLVECCPYRAASNLVATGSESKLEVLRLSFSPNSPEVKEVNGGFDFESRLDALSWDPNSRQDGWWAIGVACSNFSVQYLTNGFSSDTGPDRSVKGPQSRNNAPSSEQYQFHTVNLGSHRDYVNSVSVNSLPQMASTGDDQTLRIWDISSQQEHFLLRLRNSGRRVNFHPQDANLLLVADEGGLLQLVDQRVEIAVRSWHSGLSNLRDADWLPDSETLVAVSGNRWAVWTNIFRHAAPAPRVFSSQGLTCEKVKMSVRSPNQFATLSSGSVMMWDLALPTMPAALTPTASIHPSSISWLFNSVYLLTGGSRLFSVSYLN